jgi:hypothetical protein
MLEARDPILDRAAPFGELRPLDDQRIDLSVVHDEGVVVFRRERMQRRASQPHHRGCGDHGPGLDAVCRQHGHPVAFLETEGPEKRDNAAGRLPKFAIGPAGLIVRDGWPIGEAFDAVISMAPTVPPSCSDPMALSLIFSSELSPGSRRRKRFR